MREYDLVIFTDIAEADALSVIDQFNNETGLFVDDSGQDEQERSIYFNAISLDVGFTAQSSSVLPKEAIYRQILGNHDLSKLNRLGISLGKHVAQQRFSLPVFETLAEAGRILGKALQAKAIGWSASRNAMGFDYYNDVVQRFVNGGVFPVLGFVGLIDLANNIYETEGLSRFSGYELRLTALPDVPVNIAMRILVRLVNDIIMQGDFAMGDAIPGYADDVIISFCEPSVHYAETGKAPMVEAVMAKG
ncbi:hypothetical protein ACR9YC_08490 [Parasphingorhabdus sp. DH2-15]|uniref:hypothetical protein n=1 Tax=Parasphingorhabdus sp. DH2-15 TaxID=3444112 RepID=UPI003F685828